MAGNELFHHYLGVLLAATSEKPQFTSPLQEASYDNDKLKVIEYLERGDEVNVPSENGKTALHFATARGNEEIVDILLTAGANPFLEDKFRSLPIDYAIRGKRKKCLQIMRYHQYRKDWLKFCYQIASILDHDRSAKAKIVKIPDLMRYVTEFL